MHTEKRNKTIELVKNVYVFIHVMKVHFLYAEFQLGSNVRKNNKSLMRTALHWV